MPEEPDQKPQIAQMEFVVPDPESGLFTTYANHVQVGFTSFDIRLMFGEVIDATQEKVTVEQRAHITLSWLQAKILKTMLEQIIANYESQNGALRVPTGTVELQNVAEYRGPVIP